MKHLKNFKIFENDQFYHTFFKKRLDEYEIKDFFDEWLDDKKFDESFKLNYYSNLYFLRRYFTGKTIKDLEYAMQYVEDWDEAIYGDILYKDLFIDITSNEFKDKPKNFFTKKEQIIIKPGDDFNHKLSNFDRLILENSKRGIIPYYPIMSLTFGRFPNERFETLLELLLRFYEATGWRPFDGLWTEDYVDENDHNYIYQIYGASLTLFNGSDAEYKKLCEVSYDSISNEVWKKLDIFI